MRTTYILSGLHVLLSGSNWNNGGNAGVGNLNANNDASNSNRNNGTHLELRGI